MFRGEEEEEKEEDEEGEVLKQPQQPPPVCLCPMHATCTPSDVVRSRGERCHWSVFERYSVDLQRQQSQLTLHLTIHGRELHHAPG